MKSYTLKHNKKGIICFLSEKHKPLLFIYEAPDSFKKVGEFDDDEHAKAFVEYLSEMIGAVKK